MAATPCLGPKECQYTVEPNINLELVKSKRNDHGIETHTKGVPYTSVLRIWPYHIYRIDIYITRGVGRLSSNCAISLDGALAEAPIVNSSES
jgi:hypothetical protein